MARTWTPTTTATDHTGLKCNSTALVLGADYFECVEDGTPATVSAASTLAALGVNTVVVLESDQGLGLVTWPAGTWTIKFTNSSGTGDLDVTAAYVCRVNSAGTSLSTVASWTGTIDLATNDVKTITITQASSDNGGGEGATTDRFYIQIVVTNIHSKQTRNFSANFNQDCSIPSAGTTYDLAGSIAATAAVTGNVKIKKPLAGAIGAAATVTGNAKIVRGLAGTIAAQSSFTAHEGGKNLWPNASLESGIDDWNAVQGINISHSTAQKWQGSYSLLATPYGGWQTAQSDQLAIAASTQYTLSFYLWSENAETGWLCTVYDQGDGWQGNAAPDTSAGTWQRVSITFTTEPETTSIYLHISRGSTEDTGTWHVDAAQLELGSSATTWEDYGAGGGLQIIHAVWSLAGAVASTASLSGNLKATQKLAGAIGAASALTGDLEVLTGGTTWDLAGVVAAQAAVTGDAKVTRRLWSTDLIFHGGPPNPSGFKAGANGRIRFTYTPEIAAGKHVDTRFRHDGTNFVQVDTGWGTADIWLKWFDGSWHNVDAQTGVLTDGVPCTVDVVFSGTSITGYVDGVEQVSGTVTLNLDRDAAVLYDDLVTDDIEAWTYGAGGIKAQSALTGNLELVEGLWSLQGSIAATAALAGDLQVQHKIWDLAGTVAAQATVTSDLKVTRKLAGAISATTAITGDLELTEALWSLQGSIAATAALAGDLQVQHKTWDLAGSIASQAALVGDLEVLTGGTTWDLAGAISAQSALSGQCYVPKTYYMRADGTATTKATSTGPVTNASACMDLTHHNSYTFDPFDTIVYSDRGGDYRWDGTAYLASIMDIPSSGHAGGGEIRYIPDGSPTFLGSYDLTSATYKWTPSGSGTNEYHCELAAGGDPGLVEGDCIWMNGTRLLEGTLGALADHEWAWGDNDTLGYSTFYVRDDSGDPDTSGVVLEGTQKGCIHAYQKSYVILDGATVKYGNGASYDGGIRFDETSYCTIQNCEAHHNRGHGISLKGDHGVIDNCHASYNGAHNIVSGGSAGDPATYMEIKNCEAHHSYTMLFVPQPFDGYGIKFLWVDNSSMHNNLVYSNAVNGIDLDGDGTNPGCRYNDIYENEIYDNDIIGVMIELRSTNNRIFRNRIYDNGKATSWGNDQVQFWHGVADNELFNNVIYRTTNAAGANPLVRIGDYENTLSDGIKIYGNVFDGGGYSNNAINMDSSYATATDLKIKNNIFVNTVNTPVYLVSSSYTGFECDYNCYDDFGGTAIVSRNYTGYTKATHCSTYSQDCNSVVSDPLFEDEAAHDYSLSDTSPCKNAGVNLGADYDDGLHYTTTWPSAISTLDQDSYGSWEIGAYVYIGQLAGGIAAQAALTGNLEISEDLVLAGTIASQASLTGTLKLQQKLAGAIAAQATLTGEAKITRQLAGSVAAQSALSGTLKLQQKLAGAVAAQSTLAADLTLIEGIWPLAGTVSSSSSLTGSLALTQKLAGAVSAFSSLVGDLQVEHAVWSLGGEIYARSDLEPADLRVIRKLAGQITAASGAVGDLQVQHAIWSLAGSVSSLSSLAGNLEAKRNLAGLISVHTTVTGNLGIIEPVWTLAGTVTAQSALVGNLVNLSDIPKLLVIAISQHIVTGPGLTLTEIPLLLVSNSTHYHYAENVYVHQQLVISSGAHAHSAENVTFVLANPITIQNAAQTVTSEEVDLLNSILIANAWHSHIGSNVNIPYGAGAKEGMGLGDAVFGLKPTMKLPPYPMREEELLKWCQRLYWELQNSYIPQTDRIENMTMVGLEIQRPAPVGRRQLFYAFDTQSLWIDVMTEDADGVWSAEWFAVAAGAGTNEIHSTSLPDDDSQFLFQVDFAGGAPGGCIIQYSAYMSASSIVYARETGLVQITGFYPDYTITKVTSPAVRASGGSATFTFTQESTDRDIKAYCTGKASGFTPSNSKLNYTVWFGGATTHVLYSDE